MNSEITAMIKMKLKDAIKLNHVELKVKEIHEKKRCFTRRWII